MRSFVRFLIFAAALCLVSCKPAATLAPPAAPPVVSVKPLPTPPQQSAPWTAPETKLPSEVISAGEDFFAAGLSDPRGGEYREITVPIAPEDSPSYPPPQTTQTHGWVLPETPSDKTRYAVCWNGLVYPLTAVGAPADVDADMALLLKNSSAKPSEYNNNNPTKISASAGLAFDQMAIIKLPLLLRLGKVEQAQEIWDLWQTQLKAYQVNRDTPVPDFFAVVAREWLWTGFHRAQLAHLQGNISFALGCLQPLAEQRAKIGEFAKKRGIAETPNHEDNAADLDLTFFSQAPGLTIDEKRRAAENPGERLEEYSPDVIADKKARIALLIRDLEDVVATPIISDGYIQFEESPVVQALIAQGEDAVDPLIDCLANDQRLTRTVDNGGGRNFWVNGYPRVVGVEEPAFYALMGILKTHEAFGWLKEPYVNGTPGGGEHLDRVVLAGQIRAYWNGIRNQSLPERWYAMLQDDNATPDAWAEAAENISLPADANLFAGFGRVVESHNGGNPAVPWGESLRAKTNPSVSDLMNKRLRDAMALKSSAKYPFLAEAQKKLMWSLFKWDGKNQVETLHWYGDEMQKAITVQNTNGGSGNTDELVKTYLARKEVGDPEALSDYAQWIRQANTAKLNEISKMYAPFFLSPVWSYPDDPAMVELGRWLFEDPKSPWSIGKAGVDPTWVANGTRTGLIAVPAFRTLLVQQLSNKKVVGNVAITAPDMVMTTFVYGSGGSSADPNLPPPGTKMDLRLCDVIALRVAEIHGAPRCEPYWPIAKKDAAIQQTIQFLQRYGDRLAHKTDSQDQDFAPPDRAVKFAPLDHPATEADVAAGRAISSFEGKGERKVAPLPTFPARARWTTLKDYPTTDGSPQPSYDQDGTVWQAEDVLIDGKWQRYYGFVGKNCMKAAPGNEIQFESSDFYISDIDGWGFRVDLLENDNPPGWYRRLTGKLGSPLPTTVSVQNLNGTDRALSISLPAPGTKAEDLGLEVQLEYSPRETDSRFTFSNAPPAVWQTVTPRAPLLIDVLSNPARVAPLDKAGLLKFDLAQGYDLKAPGTYRLTLKFKKDGLLNSEGKISPQMFELTN